MRNVCDSGGGRKNGGRKKLTLWFGLERSISWNGNFQLRRRCIWSPLSNIGRQLEKGNEKKIKKSETFSTTLEETMETL